MSVKIFGTSLVGSYLIFYEMGDGERAFVSAGVTLGNEGGYGLHSYAANTRIDNFGTIVSAAGAVGLEDLNARVTNYAGGVIFSYDGTGVFLASQSYLKNDGKITGLDHGVDIHESEVGRTSEVVNTGTIESSTNDAVAHSGYDGPRLYNGTLKLTNSGQILAGPNHYAFYSYNGYGGIDQVVNTGLMRGSVYLGDGADSLDTSRGTVTGAMSGAAGNDTIYGGAAAETIYGDADNDVIRGGGGKDNLDGGLGRDVAVYSDKAAKIEATLNGATAVGVKVGGLVEDQIKNFEDIQGGSAGDVLAGDSLANRLWGQGGDDFFRGMAGKDTIDGGAGAHDLASYSDKTVSVSVSLNGATAVTVKVNGSAEDTIKNVEDIQGGSANDTLVGDSLGNRLSGLGGKDVLDGRLGNDTLTGGAGADAFRFTTSLSASNVDVITDFSRADDVIQLENAIFTALGSWGASKFLSVASGHAALTKAQRIIYDRADGSLWYDSDGSAHGHSAIKFAVLTTHPKHLDYTDFAII